MAAPSSELMDRLFGETDAISVQQTMRGCFQECCGCEAESEYKIYNGHIEEGEARPEDIPQIAHLLESSPCLCRFCCGVSRSFEMPLTLGAPDGKGSEKVFGPKVVEFRKPFSCPICFVIPSENGNINCPCCCFLPSLETWTNEDEKIGHTNYLCDIFLCVPKFGVYNAAGEQTYLVKPDTCCGGCIPKCGCGGKGSKLMYVPFFIRNPETGDALPASAKLATSGDETKAQIKKVWSGFKKECCSDADNFQVLFPEGIDSKTKANLLGTNVLIDFTFFESQNGS
jgi:hypothetical protein